MRHVLLIIVGFTAILAYIWFMMNLLFQYDIFSLILDSALYVLECST